MVDLWLVQGQKRDPLSCYILGHFEFYGLPARAAGETQVAITYRYNDNGIVEVEATDVKSQQALQHRLAKDRYTLTEVVSDQVPAHVAVILDSSGSMFGEPFEEAKRYVKQLAQRNLRSNRSMSIYTNIDHQVLAAANRPEDVVRALDQCIPIGFSSLHGVLRQAKSSDLLKDRGGVYFMVSDGELDQRTDLKGYIERVHATGGKVFLVGVGDHRDESALRELCISPSDFLLSNQIPNISSVIVNLVQMVEILNRTPSFQIRSCKKQENLSSSPKSWSKDEQWKTLPFH